MEKRRLPELFSSGSEPAALFLRTALGIIGLELMRQQYLMSQGGREGGREREREREKMEVITYGAVEVFLVEQVFQDPQNAQGDPKNPKISNRQTNPICYDIRTYTYVHLYFTCTIHNIKLHIYLEYRAGLLTELQQLSFRKKIHKTILHLVQL